MPTQVATGLIGKKIKLAVLEQLVNKQKKDDSGVYRDTNETRKENVFDKAFHIESGKTVNEYRHEVETAEFMDAWLEANKGKTRDRTKKTDGAGGTSGSGMFGNKSNSGANGGGEQKRSLFGNKK